MLQLTPGNLWDMAQTIDAADIYECAVIGEPHYGTFYYVVHREAFPNLCDSLVLFVIQMHLWRIRLCPFSIHSGNSDRKSLSYKFFAFSTYLSELRQWNKSGDFFVRCDHTAIDGSNSAFTSMIDLSSSAWLIFVPVFANFRFLTKNTAVAIVCSTTLAWISSPSWYKSVSFDLLPV